MVDHEEKLPEIIFDVGTPIDCRIRSTFKRWELICKKHSEVINLLEEVKDCLSSPDVIRKSKQDVKVFLIYKRLGKYWLSVICKKLNGVGFVITAYITDKIKEGELIWQK